MDASTGYFVEGVQVESFAHLEGVRGLRDQLNLIHGSFAPVSWLSLTRVLAGLGVARRPILLTERVTKDQSAPD